MHIPSVHVHEFICVCMRSLMPILNLLYTFYSLRTQLLIRLFRLYICIWKINEKYTRRFNTIKNKLKHTYILPIPRILPYNIFTALSERYSILLSTFLPVPDTRDPSYIYLYLGQYLDDVESAEGTVLYDEFFWPRRPEQTPGELILAVSQATKYTSGGSKEFEFLEERYSPCITAKRQMRG